MDFSWTDRFRATIGSCVPCLLTPNDSDSDDDRQRGQYYGTSAYHRDELEGLLIDSQTDNEADAMSLHSNPGIPLRGGGGGSSGEGGRGKKKGKAWRKKKKNAAARKGVKLFGYDLFGRPMPDDFDDSDDGDMGDEPLARPPRRRHFGMSSSSTLDSDAAPLSDSAIADLSKWEPPLTDADLAREEEEQRLLEEKMMRKERRKERKELKRVAAAMAAGIIRDHDTEFEGFQGSGANGAPRVPAFGKPRRATVDDEEFGPFAGATATAAAAATQSPVVPQSARAATAAFAADAAADVFGDEEDEGDFGGEYNRKSKSGNNSGSGSGSQSHSRSRSGTSSKQGGGQVATYRLPNSNPYNVPLPSSASGSTPRRTEFLDSPTPKRPKKASSSSKKDKDATRSESSNRSRSSANSSSPIRSPPPQRPSNDLGVRVMDQEFEGFPGGGLDAADVAAATAAAAAASASSALAATTGGMLSPVDGTANGFRFPAPGHPEAHHDDDADHDGTAGGFRFPAPSSSFPSTGFPSTGIGRKAGGGAAGVALARRGDA